MAATHQQLVRPMQQPLDDGCSHAWRLPTCLREELNSNAWSYVGSGRGGYMVVEKLVYVGEGKGAFTADGESQSSSLQRFTDRFCNKALLCRLFFQATLVMVLLCLLSGIVLLIPAVSSVLDKALPIRSLRGPLQNSGSPELVAQQKSLISDSIATTTGEIARQVKHQHIPGACSASCGTRMQSTASHFFQGKVGSCLKALYAVQQGSVCQGCTLWNAGCKEQRTAPEAQPALPAQAADSALSATRAVSAFDCEEGFSNCLYSWTIVKKQWCALNSKRDCPLYDCNIGFDDCSRLWSHAQKAWCQSHDSSRSCSVF